MDKLNLTKAFVTLDKEGRLGVRLPELKSVVRTMGEPIHSVYMIFTKMNEKSGMKTIKKQISKYGFGTGLNKEAVSNTNKETYEYICPPNEEFLETRYFIKIFPIDIYGEEYETKTLELFKHGNEWTHENR